MGSETKFKIKVKEAKMRKFQQVFTVLTEIRSMVRGNVTNEIKETIGDSTKNHRTLTVNQVVRFLNLLGRRKLASTVNTTASILESNIIKRRSKRTDAIDINELVTTYRKVVMDGRSDTYRRKIGSAVSKVG